MSTYPQDAVYSWY